jgi:hypothetical protein
MICTQTQHPCWVVQLGEAVLLKNLVEPSSGTFCLLFAAVGKIKSFSKDAV